MSIKQKLVLGAFLLATLPVLIAISVGSWMTSQAAHELLSEQARKQLVAVRDSKRMQIEDYFRHVQSQLETFAEDRMIVDAMRQEVAAIDKDHDRIRHARIRGYEGEACAECGNFTLVRNGTCLKCDTCGATSGCS